MQHFIPEQYYKFDCSDCCVQPKKHSRRYCLEIFFIKYNCMNLLRHETSPYLLQHKNNPVDWYAWKPEALEKARREDKPILVSIGYSTCHWCHVMEHESFEDERTAAYMNAHFVCIKVDREERPDLDQIYMEACQLINGNGGWPLNCFLLPDGRPYFAGTYYPPQSNYGRPSWLQVLQRMAQAYYEDRDTAVTQAKKLTEIIAGSGTSMLRDMTEGMTPALAFSPVTLQQIFAGMRERFDPENGGFGTAPKFPGAMSLAFLLRHYHFTDNAEARRHLLLSLNKMVRGGIYDLLGGGFARYATDAAWLNPHFEKMLYDNALLVSVLSETMLKIKDDADLQTEYRLYDSAVRETLAWVKREMTSPEGGFYSATDADSEGEEGKFFVWSEQEVDEILGDDSKLFKAYYDVTEGGNREHRNILWRRESLADFAAKKGTEADALEEKFAAQREKLFAEREKRIRPGLDDKILLDWNALLCTAYCKAFHAVQKEEYRQAAVKNINFLLNNFRKDEEGAFFHTYKEGQKQYDAFLNDYAFLIEALLAVYQITFETRYLTEANRLCAYVIDNFLDKADNLFYFTSRRQKDVIIRRKDLYDNAQPSGNSTMAGNLQKTGILFGNEDYKQLAARMLVKTKESTERFPTAFSRWANVLTDTVYAPLEIAVTGPDAEKVALDLQRYFLPAKVITASTEARDDFPLLAHKPADDTYIYVCRDYACDAPMRTVAEFLEKYAPKHR